LESVQSRLFNILLKAIKKKTLLNRRFAHKKIDIFNHYEPTKKILSSYHVDKYQVKGRNVFTLNPGEGHKHILYLHGGAYVEGFLRPHWDFMHMLIKDLDCTITAPDYPLAPENTYLQTFEMMSELYRQLIEKVDQKDFVIMGDSSGGGLALALAQKMRIENIRQPAQIILLSPWLDIGLTNPEIKDIDPSDLFLGVDSLRVAGKAYAGDADPGSYLLSPVNGPLDGLGKISVFIGSREILVADARKLKARSIEEGIGLNYYEYTGMFHTWMLLNFPESKKAKRQIISIIRSGKCKSR
jgi:acetyl esterase/lipase